jgi:hypothetical protein
MSETVTSNWRFERAEGVAGFMRTQRVSTDALNVLYAWAALDARRSFTVLKGYEADDFMTAALTTARADANAGASLDRLALENGVSRDAT